MGNILRDWPRLEKKQAHLNAALVSVICTCYNHAKFIKSALDSVLQQSHENTELIIIDNGSKDSSPEIIQNWIGHNPILKECKSIFHPSSINYCQSFNQALQLARGKYVIDLSGDDLLLSNHIATAVETLETGDAGVYFSNAYLEGGKHRLWETFYPIDRKGNIIEEVASGNIYLQVVQKNFLCAPTLVFRTQLLKSVGGYDEELSYEDFDIIVRMARLYGFAFHDNIGVKKRILTTSFSAKQYSIKDSIMLPSTLRVCRKIQEMNKTQEENQALQLRVIYETKHALASANFDIAAQFLTLAREIGVSGLLFRFFLIWEMCRLDFSLIYRILSHDSLSFSRKKFRKSRHVLKFEWGR